MLLKPEYRILLGTIGFIVVLAITAGSGLENYNPDATIVSAAWVAIGGLLTAGLVKHFSKKG